MDNLAMFALSRQHDRIFLYDPGIGISVPVVVDLIDRTFSVEFPSVEELESDFAAFDELEEILETTPSEVSLIDSGVEFSRFYSDRFRHEIEIGNVSLARLKEMIRQYPLVISGEQDLGGESGRGDSAAQSASEHIY